MVIGTLVYNEIVVIPFFGFDKNTKSAIEKRKVNPKGSMRKGEKDIDFVPLSPHAAFDSTRNMRNL